MELAKLLEEAGYDGLSIDGGYYEAEFWAHPPKYLSPGFNLDLAAQIKSAVGIPIMVAGRVGRPDVAERAIAEVKTDIVALGRDLIADPEWPMKVARGSVEAIRPCIGCHDGCMDRPRTDGTFL